MSDNKINRLLVDINKFTNKILLQKSKFCSKSQVLYTNPQIIKLDEMITISKILSKNKTIGITTGCFDIFHSGHLKSIKSASTQCDILILLLNSDKSIKKLKGDNRPINSLENRLDLLSELPYIDYIVIFDEPDADSLLNRLFFHTLFKGGDYKIKELQDKFPKINIILTDKVNNSTTNIVDSIRDIYK